MITGNRKQRGFYLAITAMCGIIIMALLNGVNMSGDNIVNLVFAITGLSGLFFGGNAVEHFSKNKQTGSKNENS